jgi:hypothetical protein
MGEPTHIDEHQCAHHTEVGDKDISNDVFFIYFVELSVCLSAPHMPVLRMPALAPSHGSRATPTQEHLHSQPRRTVSGTPRGRRYLCNPTLVAARTAQSYRTHVARQRGPMCRLALRVWSRILCPIPSTRETYRAGVAVADLRARAIPPCNMHWNT